MDLKDFKLDSLKTMSLNELDELASLVRTEIINQVSINGGHLASNLGVVELSIALHYVFNSPKDKFIFDVSHQTYTHKILTGRSLENLRSISGVSGFAKMNESEHDVYEGGHSSTSIAAGLGFLYAKEQDPSIGEVISIIGDASVTNGLAFEALNFLGAHPEKKMIIIINDNEMSISKNVGALAKTFNKIRIGKGYNTLKKITPSFLRKFFSKINSSLKTMVYNNKFFTSLGYTYIEGIDGHNFKQLIKYLKYAKDSKKSVVLHVKTIKGKGYKFAEEDKIGKWHNVGPFDILTGKPLTNYQKQTGEYIADYLNERNYDDMFVITPAMTLGSGLKSFEENHPEKFIDVGIAEELAVVIASGLSVEKKVPFVFVYSSFLQRTYDEILHDAARTNQHIIFCVDRTGIISSDGDTHQGIYDLAFLKTIPNVNILEPCCISDLYKMLDFAYQNHGVYVIRYPKVLSLYNKECNIKSFDTIRNINHINVLTYGNNTLEINDYLISHNLEYGIINLNSLTNIDDHFIEILPDYSTLYCYEECIKTNSISSYLEGNDLIKNKKINLISVTLPDTYLVTGTKEEIKRYYHIDYDSVFLKK